MGKIYWWAKSIHRIAMWGVVVFGLVIGITGSSLKFGWELANDRIIHNLTSIWFLSFLTAMTVSGLLMYLIPLLPKKPVV